MLSATVGLKKKTDRFRLINYQPGYCEKEVRKSVWEHLKRSWVFVARRLIEMEIGWGIIGGGKKLTLPLCLLFFFPNFFGLLLCTTVTTLATSGMWVFSPTPSSSLWHQLYVLQFISVMTPFTWREHQILQVKCSVPWDFSPPKMTIPLSSCSGCPQLSFNWAINLKFPWSPPPWIWSFAQKTTNRTRGNNYLCLIIYYITKTMLKDTINI